MATTALFFDVLQFLLGFLYMGWLVGFFAALTFWLWFRMQGVPIGFGKPKRVIGFGITSLLEVTPIPFLASLPAWTAFVLITAIQNKIQDVASHVPGAKLVEKSGIIKGK